MNNDAAIQAARSRVGALLDELSRIQLQVVVVGLPDATRRAARERARDAAIVAGRGALLDEATSTVREAVLRTFSRAGFSGTWAVTDMAVSVVRARDRVAAAAAFEEAAMAAIVEDLVDTETLDILRSTHDQLRAMAGMPAPGSLASVATPPSDLDRPWTMPLGIAMAALALVGAVAALSVASVSGAIAFVFGAAVLVGVARRRRRPEGGSTD
jgi:hypothetical protein